VSPFPRGAVAQPADARERFLQEILGRVDPGMAGVRVRLRNERELRDWCDDVLGVRIPHRRICVGHKAPLEAMADAYFAAYPRTVWKASRLFGGKTAVLATLSMAEAITLGAGVTLLGGSLKQSQQAHQYMRGAEGMAGKFWRWPKAPRHLLRAEPTLTKTTLGNDGWIQALAASAKAVRGPHPQRLRGDEIDEMSPAVWDDAQGQAKDDASRHIKAQVVACSTLHHADGTMMRELRMATERHWPIYEWCYKETMAKGGFVTLEEVARKKASVTRQQWDVEFELQEPAVENRAIDSEAVDLAFDPKRGMYDGGLGEGILLEAPDENARYATGADWGQKLDRTIIWTIRHDVRPARLVAFTHVAREAWPDMIALFNAQVQRFPGTACHDMTGIGNVIDAYLEVRTEGVSLVGLKRTNLFREWIAALESGDFIAPRIEYTWREHKYCTNDMLFGSGHPPDSFVGAALAWRAASHPALEIA
jgi:hypothetical protein